MPAQSALIVEPNAAILEPYSYLPVSLHPLRVENPTDALDVLSTRTPVLCVLSASYPIEQTIVILDALRQSSRTFLIPLVIVVDLSVPVSYIPGTTWGDKVAVIDRFVPPNVFKSTIHRVV